MSKIVIIDTVCNKAYDNQVFLAESLGGSEATALRIAIYLSDTHAIALEQHNRAVVRVEGPRLRFTPLETEENADIVILMRVQDYYKRAKERFPRAKFVIWMHDWATERSFNDYDTLKGITKLCVSESLSTQCRDFLKIKYYYPEALFNYKVKTIHNVLDIGISSPISSYDKNKLCFISSPHKGLKKTLEVFMHVNRMLPETKLYIANPGYLPSIETDIPNIVNLRERPFYSLMENIKDSMCLLYPNDVFPETFGLVVAECNALGIPVLTYRLGALPELINNPAQYLKRDMSIKDIADKVISWYNGNRPFVRKNLDFTPQRIIPKWERLIVELMNE